MTDQTNNETKVQLSDGKYAVIHCDGQGLRALRYGEPWRDLSGDGLVLAMAQEIERLRAALSSAPAAISTEDIQDRLVAISEAIADQDDRAAQAMLRETLKLLSSAPAAGSEQEALFHAVAVVLQGIDRTEAEDPGGWWETSAGADFGRQRLEMIRALLAQYGGTAQWIPVSERLPEPGVDVLVRGNSTRGQKYDIAGLFHDEWASHVTQDDCRLSVTDWMPLPPAPQEGK